MAGLKSVGWVGRDRLVAGPRAFAKLDSWPVTSQEMIAFRAKGETLRAISEALKVKGVALSHAKVLNACRVT